MKSLGSIVIVLVMGSAAFGALAADRDERELAVCATELRAFYGPDTQIKLVDRQRSLYGTHLKVAASTDADNASFASCWVDKDDLAAIDADEGAEQVVAIEPLGR